jgi:hypothetical protein
MVAVKLHVRKQIRPKTHSVESLWSEKHRKVSSQLSFISSSPEREAMFILKMILSPYFGALRITYFGGGGVRAGIVD